MTTLELRNERGKPEGGVRGATDHLIPLPGGRWVAWRLMVLRGAGFPAEHVLRLAAPGCASEADRVLALERRCESARRRALEEVDRCLDEIRARGEWGTSPRRRPLMKVLRALAKKNPPRPDLLDGSLSSLCRSWGELQQELADRRRGFAERFAADVGVTSEEIEKIARWSPFREAVTWQNRHARRTALDLLVRQGGGTVKRNSQRRQHEEMVASYLQRYAVKNDTVGFFGPVGWARVVPEGEVVRLRAGDRVIAAREVYFENWCIDALARKLGSRPEMRKWIAPRLKSSVFLEGEILYPPFGPPVKLGREEARLLAACDGRVPAHSIALELIADPIVAVASESAVYAMIERFAKKRVLVWNLEVPLELHPERNLRKQLERIGPTELRAWALAALDELEQARAEVARAAGDDERLDRALESLEETFTRLTGSSPRRHQGQTYAARGLVYEDCRRQTTLELGAEIVHRLGPPLTLVLKGARWMIGELNRRVEGLLYAIYRDLRERTRSSRVQSHLWLSQVLSALFFKRQRHAIFTEVAREYQERWLRALSLDSGGDRRRAVSMNAAELRGRVAREFADPAPAWFLTRYFGPDVMIAANGEEALRRGDFQIVLGEIHTGNCMCWSCFLAQHPDPGELKENMAIDLEAGFGVDPRSVVLPQLQKKTITQRMSVSLLLPHFHRYRFGDDPPEDEGPEPLPAGSVWIVEGAGALEARTRDGRLSFAAIDLLGFYLWQETNDIMGSLLPAAQHWPRITVDDVVIARESWRFAVAELEFVTLKAEERFLAVRRWALQHGIPRFCFYKVSTERKPCYLDLDSPIYVDLLVRLIRSAARADSETESLSISEMLPRLDQTWLSDADGQRYTCELRTVCYEPQERLPRETGNG